MKKKVKNVSTSQIGACEQFLLGILVSKSAIEYFMGNVE